MKKNIFKWSFIYLLPFFLLLFGGWNSGFSEEEETAGLAALERPQTEYEKLNSFVQMSLKVEDENIAILKKELESAEKNARNLNNEISAYKVQLSTFRSLLHLPKTRIEDLENALDTHRNALENIAVQLKNYEQKQIIIAQRLLQAEEQYTLNENQFFEISTEGPDTAGIEALVETSQKLLKRLTVKINQLEEIQEFFDNNIKLLKDEKNEFSQFYDKLKSEIELRKKKQIFTRQDNSLLVLNFDRILSEVDLLLKKVKNIFLLSYWQTIFLDIWNSKGILFFSVLFLFMAALGLLIRFNSQCPVKKNEEGEEMTWQHVIYLMIRRSLLLFVGTVFLFFFSNIHQLSGTIPFTAVAFELLLILLFTQWIRHFFILWNCRRAEQAVAQELLKILLSAIRLIRYFACSQVVLGWLISETSVLLLLLRLAFELALLIKCMKFWKKYRPLSSSESSEKGMTRRDVIEKFTFIICTGGLVSELTGYGFFAVFWYAAWGRTIIALLWSSLIFKVLREWREKIKRLPDTHAEEVQARSVKWFLLQICWPFWIIFITISLIVSWGGDQSLILGIFNQLNQSIQVGGMSLNLMGFIYAFIVLSLLHVSMRLWKDELLNRILPDEKYERGLKTSVSSITSYIFWSVGLLISFSLVGVSTASLTVVFGAISVGLGFGLQNIFNNFVSGIILLFERPIQVGDVVEVDGMWGEVKTINIRATQIQTYDNASMIIPNSQFISSKVTNWSFKDMRLRRRINIGVAYGSDIEKVRDIVLDVAGKTKNVLSHPEPSLVFMEFGDSSLIFTLRYWTWLDDYFTTQTDIYFEINRLFKEHGIEIPFPQRDIHIRSAPEKENAENPSDGGSLKPKADSIDNF